MSTRDSFFFKTTVQRNWLFGPHYNWYLCFSFNITTIQQWARPRPSPGGRVMDYNQIVNQCYKLLTCFKTRQIAPIRKTECWALTGTQADCVGKTTLGQSCKNTIFLRDPRESLKKNNWKISYPCPEVIFRPIIFPKKSLVNKFPDR